MKPMMKITDTENYNLNSEELHAVGWLQCKWQADLDHFYLNSQVIGKSCECNPLF